MQRNENEKVYCKNCKYVNTDSDYEVNLCLHPIEPIYHKYTGKRINTYYVSLKENNYGTCKYYKEKFNLFNAIRNLFDNGE